MLSAIFKGWSLLKVWQVLILPVLLWCLHGLSANQQDSAKDEPVVRQGGLLSYFFFHMSFYTRIVHVDTKLEHWQYVLFTVRFITFLWFFAISDLSNPKKRGDSLIQLKYWWECGVNWMLNVCHLSRCSSSSSTHWLFCFGNLSTIKRRLTLYLRFWHKQTYSGGLKGLHPFTVLWSG